MIQVKNVSKSFGTERALSQVNCSFPQGSICGLVGSNGAGKSTLLRLLGGVYRADEGEVTLDGAPVYENPEAKARIFYLSDEPYFPAEADLTRMGMLYRAFYPGFDTAYLKELAGTLRLDMKKRLRSFSKGMRRQAAVILALAARPDYLLMDETFDGVDPIVRQYLRRLICAEVAERGIGVLLTSHSLRELEDLCDQLGFLHRGGLIFEKDTDQLRTSLFKVQTAFAGEYDESIFEGFEVLRCTRSGSVAKLIVRGSREQVTEQIRKKDPLLLEILPLSLDEVFTYELEALGYAFEEKK